MLVLTQYFYQGAISQADSKLRLRILNLGNVIGELWNNKQKYAFIYAYKNILLKLTMFYN